MPWIIRNHAELGPFTSEGKARQAVVDAGLATVRTWDVVFEPGVSHPGDLFSIGTPPQPGYRSKEYRHDEKRFWRD